MPTADFSLSFAVETDEEAAKQLVIRLDKQLVGRIKDLIAKSLDGLDFDLRQRYWLLSPEMVQIGVSSPHSTQSIPIWSSVEHKFISVKVGSPEWFEMIGDEKKFSYYYGKLTFTVRFETRKSKGKEYSYWRAYATINGKLFTKQLGTTESLTKEALDAAGAYFLSVQEQP